MQQRSKGSALITALFIMTLVAIAATAMSTRLQLDIYRTRLSIASDKLYLASQAISFWALDELSKPKIHFTTSDPQGKILDFPIKLQTIYPGANLSGSLYDLQARFNLNNVSDKKFQLAFTKLLKFAKIKLNQDQRNTLARTLGDWLDTYQPGVNSSLNISYYLNQKPPYQPAQQLMHNISEFRLLEGVNATIYRALLAYIIVLPERTPININTASKPVLRTLGAGLNEEQVNEIIAKRGKKGIRDLTHLNPLWQKLNIRNEHITIESTYYMSVANVAIDDLNSIHYTVIKRSKDKKGKPITSIISESFNTFE